MIDFLFSWSVFLIACFLLTRPGKPDEDDSDVDERKMGLRSSSGPTVRLVLVRHPQTEHNRDEVTKGVHVNNRSLEEKKARYRPTAYGRDMFERIVDACTLGNYAAGGYALKQVRSPVDYMKVKPPVFATVHGPNWGCCDDQTWFFNRMLLKKSQRGEIEFDQFFELGLGHLGVAVTHVPHDEIRPYVIFCTTHDIHWMLSKALGVPQGRLPIPPIGSATVIDAFRTGPSPHQMHLLLQRVGDTSVCMPHRNLSRMPAFPHNKPDDHADLMELASF